MIEGKITARVKPAGLGGRTTARFRVRLSDGREGVVEGTAIGHHPENAKRMRAPWYLAPGAHVLVDATELEPE